MKFFIGFIAISINPNPTPEIVAKNNGKVINSLFVYFPGVIIKV